MWILFLLAVFFVGYLISKSFFRFLGKVPLLATSFGVGSILSVWFVYLVSIMGGITTGIILYFLVVLCIAFSEKEKINKSVLQAIVTKQTILLIVVFVFSFSLFQRSFSYDFHSSEFLISSNLYQDMGAHIPFIRSFSQGENYPAEVPFFAGRNLLYHFMFDLYAGILEFLGLNLVYAYNLVGALALTFLLMIIYEVSVNLFGNSIVGILSSLLFLFNNDFSFLDFLKKNGLSQTFLSRVWHNSEYSSLSFLNLPYSNFLNINVLLNQRHFVFGLLIFFIIIYILINPKTTKKELKVVAILIGLLPFWHIPIFIAATIIFLLFLLFKFTKIKSEIIFFLLLLISFPQIILIKLNSVNFTLFRPGFLVWDHLSIQSFGLFWFFMFGIAPALSLIALKCADKKQRLFFLLFISLFIIPNIFQFGPDMFDNHKFFNIFVVCLNIFASYGLYIIFKKNIFGKLVVFCLLTLMFFSGFLNLFVVKNDVYARVSDYKKTPLLVWAKNNIPNKSIIFTNGEIYDSASLIGKKIFLTRPHHVFSYGGNPSPRMIIRDQILLGSEINSIKTLLSKEKIDYIIIYKQNVPNRVPVNNFEWIKMYKKIYEDNYGIIIKI